jgi:diguanylate cyclase (GGDEF)-like protein
MAARRPPAALAVGLRRAWRGVSRWQVWTLAEPLRSYVLAVPLLAVIAIGLSSADTRWYSHQALIFVALLACGATAIEATRKVKDPQGTTVRDLQSVWYLTIAIILPPVYAFIAPIPLTVYRLARSRRMMVYRRVFSNATICLAYGSASAVFHSIPIIRAGSHPGTGNHVLKWTGVVAACALLGWLINAGLLLGAIKISDSGVRLRELFGSRESITSDAIEVSLAVSVSLVVAISPVLMILALPTVIMQRHYLMHLQLSAHARIDSKTGLLNAATWQREATAELSRALRTRVPLALAMVDIDHFKDVEMAGDSVRDQLLRDIADMLKDQLPGHDLIGRFGGEEFAILLPHTGREEAKRISERLRDHIAAEPIAIESGSQEGFVFRLTVSIGVAVLNESRRALAELVGAADSALDQAKSTGWNKVCILSDGPDGHEESQGDISGW